MKVELGKLLIFNGTGRNGSAYLFKCNIPENGRIRIIVEDCQFEGYNQFCFNNKSSVWWETGTEKCDSGWITVKPGSFSGSIDCIGGINKEAKFMVMYERLDEYLGECEDNDTFDTATMILPNNTYEGNYSKYLLNGGSDTDIYKFQMTNPGLAQIAIQNEFNLKINSVLYEEDENGNVYEIADFWNNKRMRLDSGIYYLELCTINAYQYSLRVDVDYESSDAYEQEPNNVKSQANIKKLNTWYTGNLNTTEDIDYFKFNIDRRSWLALELKVPRQIQSNSVKISLYDANLKLLNTASNTMNPYLKTQEQIFEKGIYYVRVEGSYLDNDYSFCLSQFIDKSISELTYSSVGSKTYTGKEIRPSVTIKDGITTLKKGTDYKLSYKNNINIGKAKVIITGIGNYTGTKTIYFNIIPKPTCITKLKTDRAHWLNIQWRSVKECSGYQVQYAPQSDMSDGKYVAINKNSIRSYTRKDVAVGDYYGSYYYVRVRTFKVIDGKRYYSNWSSIKYAYVHVY